MLRVQCIREDCENGIKLHDEHADIDYKEESIFVKCSCGAPMLMGTDDLNDLNPDEILNTLVGTSQYCEEMQEAFPAGEVAFP